MDALPGVVVLQGDGPFHSRARQLAAQLGLPCCAEAGPALFALHYDANGLHLVRQGDRQGLRVDWLAGKAAYRRSDAGQELLLKAFGKYPQQSSLLDATAGWCSDSLVLAGGGFQVTAVERHPVVHALVLDARERAAAAGGLDSVLDHLSLQCGDARSVMQCRQFDAVFLDPMFPAREKSAAVKKPMVYLQTLLGELPDSADGLALALACARYRVVVKRPKHAPPLPGRAPDAVHHGKAIRLDVYVNAAWA